MRTRLGLAHLTIVGLAVLVPHVSFAYVDPGTGSLLIQWIFGMVVAGFAVANIYWHRFKQFLGRVGRRDHKHMEETKEPRPE